MSSDLELRHIVFVDDDTDVLKALASSLHAVRRTWRTSFSDSGESALAIMERERCDVIVTDMRMRGMDGSALLAKVREEHPGVIRFVLSGHIDGHSSLCTLSCAHQWLGKPCSREDLLRAIERACSIRDLYENPQLARAVGSIDALPVLPAQHRAILERLGDPECSVAEVSGLVAADPALCARFLQMINSSIFGLRRPVVEVADAVAMLGLRWVEQVMLSSGAFQVLTAGSRAGTEWHAGLLRESSLVSRLASSLVTKTGQAPTAATAGMLHDLGSLLLWKAHRQEYPQVLDGALRSRRPLVELEREAFGMNHAEVGAVLLGIWGLPLGVVEAVAYHHAPRELGSDGLAVAEAVYLARALIDDLSLPVEARRGPAAVDRDLVLRLGHERVPAEWWRRATELLERTEDAEGVAEEVAS